MPSISFSKYNTLRTCPRLFYWEHVRYMERAREDGARGFGKLYHAGLEAWWRRAGGGDAPWAKTDEALVDALKAIDANSHHIDTDNYEVAKARAMMVAYHATYFDLEFTRLGEGVEEWYSVPLLDSDGHEVKGWKQIGRKDAIVLFDGRVGGSIIEHKSTASDITSGSDYWLKLDVDNQVSMYLDSARGAPEANVVEVMWDASKKPDVAPHRETPEAKRTYTKGKGCKDCGGTASGDIKPGSGYVLIERGGKKKDKLVPAVEEGELAEKCPSCNGSGWKEVSRLHADQRTSDEPVEEYAQRVASKLAENPDAYFRMAPVTRDENQVAEARADLVAATVEIDSFYARARASAPSIEHPRARQCFPRNTNACLNVYGRRCDFLDVCSGTINPIESPLYRIKQKQGASK